MRPILEMPTNPFLETWTPHEAIHGQATEEPMRPLLEMPMKPFRESWTGHEAIFGNMDRPASRLCIETQV